jgi:hypothetical protein
MQATLNKVLFGITALTVVLTALWAVLGHFDIETWAYSLLLVMEPIFIGGAIYYARRRREAGLVAILAAAAFLLAFSTAASLLSYLALTIAGPRIDGMLAGVDLALGFHWVRLMTVAAGHPALTHLLLMAYLSVMPQTIVLILLLGWRERIADIYGLCFALSVGALTTIAVWTAFPSFGAFSVFHLPPDVAARLGLALNGDYGRDLVLMLRNGPGHISPTELRGLIGFPSYHTVQALVLIWYARHIPYVRWLALALNVVVLIATPIHGGHHVIDMIGGAGVALFAVIVANGIIAAAARAKPAEAAPSDAVGSYFDDQTGTSTKLLAQGRTAIP